MSEDKIFIDGLFIKDIPDTAPEYILGSYSINISKFKAWMDTHEDKAVRGWLNITIKRSQKGTKYAELNTYQPSQASPEATQSPVSPVNQAPIPTIQQNQDMQDLASQVPF